MNAMKKMLEEVCFRIVVVVVSSIRGVDSTMVQRDATASPVPLVRQGGSACISKAPLGMTVWSISALDLERTSCDNLQSIGYVLMFASEI